MIKIKTKLRQSGNGLRDFKKKITEGPSKVAVGLLGSEDSELLVYAAKNEFGAEGIPERPFIRQTFDKVEPEMQANFIKLAKLVISGEMTKEQALEIGGDTFLIEIRKAIENREFKANSEVTIRKKGSDKPLVDSGRLQQSLKTEVR